MEVKVDPTLYFSNASQSGNEIEQDSQDEQDNGTIDNGLHNINSNNICISKNTITTEIETKSTDLE